MSNRYDKEKIGERGSTSVVVIVLAIVSILVFTFGLTMMSIWMTNSEQEKRIQDDEVQAVIATRTHYNIDASNTDRAVMIKEDVGGSKYFIVILGTRVFHAEMHWENDIRIYNLKELEV